MSGAWSIEDRMAMNILHLVDLKRAGFRGRHGELSIPPADGGARIIAFTSGAHMSMVGSPAASCAVTGQVLPYRTRPASASKREA